MSFSIIFKEKFYPLLPPPSLRDTSAGRLCRNSGNQHKSRHAGAGRYPGLIDFPGFTLKGTSRVALRLHGTRDLKGYDKKGNCDPVCSGRQKSIISAGRNCQEQHSVKKGNPKVP